MIKAVEDAIDPLEIRKDNRAYTFHTSIEDAIARYFRFEKENPKEQKRFDKQNAKHEKLKARGKNVDWKVVPANIVDLDLLKANICNVIAGLADDFGKAEENVRNTDFKERRVELIDFFKDRASKVVYKITRSMAKESAIKLMDEVGISEPRMRYNQYPFEFSGGMRQRIVIAIALTADPEILICDEPTTALDVTIQAQILELINDLKAKRNLSIIFITHDLGVVANMADDIAVMYAGKIVEQGTASDIFYDPRHPYTWALLSSMPDLDTKEKLESIPGTPPNMIYPPVGDAFAERNKYAMQIDYEMQPPMFEISETHKAATWLLHPNAPKLETPTALRERIARMKAKNNNGGEANV
ncbi:MAG: ATP-binding cassette domain-containing protein [Lachnospiraceae bacterium]|nr:ATP-binding cassette domain-containing protein [Lachnospiraceae bacterium]